MIVEQFKTLGDPVRWAIVRELRTGTRCACDLAAVADVSPPLLSHHLKVLREADLIARAANPVLAVPPHRAARPWRDWLPVS
jgi:DNA-binding transcriptional ArsR family regulator